MPKPASSRTFDVCLMGQRIGSLAATHGHSRFTFDDAYLQDPERAVLGLHFEDDPRASHAASGRLPAWFSNLLPEGVQRGWIAAQRGVSERRELDLLAEVGLDLPGAVTVVESASAQQQPRGREILSPPPRSGRRWRFSLAGVNLKFSMLKTGQRFAAPASNGAGDWILKLPDRTFPEVPRNEFAMMTLANRAGIDVPEIQLVHRDEIELPNDVWPTSELHAYAVKRFDREGDRRVHMEDLAQVRGFYDNDKYRGSFETVANLIYRRRDKASLREFARRLAFNVLVENADAHLKNWSLLYRNPRVPVLSPLYDVVATSVYKGIDRDLGLKLCGSRLFERVSLASFRGIADSTGVHAAELTDVVEQTINSAVTAWPELEDELDLPPVLLKFGDQLAARRSRILRG